MSSSLLKDLRDSSVSLGIGAYKPCFFVLFLFLFLEGAWRGVERKERSGVPEKIGRLAGIE